MSNLAENLRRRLRIHLARARALALVAAPPLSLPMRPALSSLVGAALPEPPLLSLARPALSSRVSSGAAHSALTPLSPREGAALPLSSSLRRSRCHAAAGSDCRYIHPD